MPVKEVQFLVKDYGSRQELRKSVVQKFLEEEPGRGTGRLTSHYRYYVEKLGDGRRIFLTRPAWLKFGFDFVIRVEETTFINGRDNPSHEDLLKDLQRKRNKEPQMYTKLLVALNQVFDCEDPAYVLLGSTDLDFTTGHSPELILKLCKWLWIEQDIRYWNYSGRFKLIQAIENIG